MKNRILSLVLALAMMVSMESFSSVSAAEVEVDGGSSVTAATAVDYNTDYVVSMETKDETQYFSFTTLSNEAFYTINFGTYTGAWKVFTLCTKAEKELERTSRSPDQEGKWNLKLAPDETYYFKIVNGHEEIGNCGFSIEYKKDPVADTAKNASPISANRKYDYEIDGDGDIDFFTFVPEESKVYYVTLANATGYWKVAEVTDANEQRVQKGNSVNVGYSRTFECELTAGETYYLNVSGGGAEGKYSIIVEDSKECEHRKTSRNNKVTEYEEIRGDENYHYIIKYYDEICDECKETVKSRVQESKYTERHNFSGNYCQNCDYEKAEEQVKDEPTYTPPTTTPSTPSYDDSFSNDDNDYSKIFEEYGGFIDGAQININYKIDIIMLVNLGILAGYPDGSIKPKNTLTRAEAAKLIYILNVGEDDNGAGYANANYFNDVDGNAKWAKGYINYCYQKGIVSGIGKGKFNPNGKLKYAEFAKMLAVSLGCNADKEGFKGSDWMANVTVKSIDTGLFDGWAGDPSGAASREVVCKFIVNALRAPVYRYNDQGNGSQLADWWTGEYNITLGEELGIISDIEIWEEYDRLAD